MASDSSIDKLMFQSARLTHKMMEVWHLKVIILIGMFIGTYIFALLPIKLMGVAKATKNPITRRRIDRYLR